MKILFVNKYNYLRSGTERYMFNLKHLLEQRGNEIELFCMAHPRNRSARYESSFVTNVDFHDNRVGDIPRLVQRVLWDPVAARSMGHVLDLFRPDLVHLFNIYHHISPSVLSSMNERGIPVIQTVNDYKLICPNYLLYTNGRPCLRCRGGRFYNAVVHRCLHGSLAWSTLAAVEMLLHRTMSVYPRHVSLFVAPSRFVQTKLHEFGINPEQTRYLPYCIFDNLPENGREPNGEGTRVLYFGRLSREKGLKTLVTAMANLPHLELCLAGDGSARTETEQVACALGLSNVHFSGHAEAADLQRLVASARVTVVPSEWYEVFGQSVAESLLLSRPVVASRIGGIPEVMDDGEHGLLVPPGDASALADALDWLTWHRSIADEMGQAGRDSILQRFDAERHYHGLLELYNQVLA